MRVFEVMTKHVHTVLPVMAADEAWDLMRRRQIHHLVVTQDNGIAGVVSDRDLGGKRGLSLRRGRTVGELMTPHAVTVGPEDTTRAVANLMRGRTIGCVPVVDKGHLVGIVTVSDLLQLLGRGAGRPITPTRADTHYRVPHRKRADRRAAW